MAGLILILLLLQAATLYEMHAFRTNKTLPEMLLDLRRRRTRRRKL